MELHRIKWLIKRLPHLFERNRRVKAGGIKLCLGCDYSLVSEGWLSVSLCGYPDFLDDAATLSKIPAGSCDIILASHVLEHLDYSGSGRSRADKTTGVLGTWHGKLRPGGRCIICVPDMDLIVGMLHEHGGDYWELEKTIDRDVIAPLFGNMDSVFNVHSMAYNFSCVRSCMERAGFSEIRRISDNDSLLSKHNPSARHWITLNVEGVCSK